MANRLAHFTTSLGDFQVELFEGNHGLFLKF